MSPLPSPAPACCCARVLAPLTPAAAPADRFALLIEVLCRAIAARVGRGLAGPLIILIVVRLRRMAGRFASLTARRQAAPAANGPAAPRRRRAARAGLPPARLPRGFGWLVRLVPQAAAGAAQLQHLLTDPEMAALIAAAPQAGRILRPLCRMLGVRPPPGPLTPPLRPRAPQPLRPASSGRAPPAAAPPPRPPTPRRLATKWMPRCRLPACLPPFPA